MMPFEEQDEEIEVVNIDETKVILWNDDHNTFDWVIECLIDVCGHTQRQAEQCSIIVHTKGKCVVKQGELSNMRKIKNKLQSKKLTVSIF